MEIFKDKIFTIWLNYATAATCSCGVRIRQINGTVFYVSVSDIKSCYSFGAVTR